MYNDLFDVMKVAEIMISYTEAELHFANASDKIAEKNEKVQKKP